MPKSPAKKSTAVKPYPVWICVFELSGLSVPRRFPEKPHVRVEQKAIRPGPDLNAWLTRSQSGKHPELVRVLEEEMPKDHERGGLLCPFEWPRDETRIKAALKKLRERLRCDRYTVGRSTGVYHVYVIRLKDAHIRNRPPNYRGLVYVGQTGTTVEERVLQHKLGEEF